MAKKVTKRTKSKAKRTRYGSLPISKLLAAQPCSDGLRDAISTLHRLGLIIVPASLKAELNDYVTGYTRGLSSDLKRSIKIILDPDGLLGVMRRDELFRQYTLKMLKAKERKSWLRELEPLLLEENITNLKQYILDQDNRIQNLKRELQGAQEHKQQLEANLADADKTAIPEDDIFNVIVSDDSFVADNWETVSSAFDNALRLLARGSKPKKGRAA